MDIQNQIEKNVISHLIALGKSGDIDKVYETISKIEPSHFTDERHRILYSIMVNIIVKKRKIDILSLHQELNVGNKLELVGGNEYLADLSANRERSTSIESVVDALIVQDKKRRLKEELNIALQEVDETTEVDGVIASLDNRLYNLQSRQNETMVDTAKVVEEVIHKANNASKRGCYGYSWGIPTLDMMTGGIEIGKSYVIGASKKSGKSKWVIHTIKSLVKQKVRSHFLSLEMGGESVVKELISSFAEIDNNLLRMPLDVDVENRIRSITHNFDYVEIDTQSYLNLMQIRHKVRQASQRGCKVVFLDYLQRMNFQKGTGSNDAKVIADTCAQLADIAKEYQVAFIYLSQLRNSADNEIADVSHLKDSGGIAEAVDCIMVLNNLDRIEKNYDEATKKRKMIVNVEQRSAGSGMVELKIDLSMSKFEEYTEVF